MDGIIVVNKISNITSRDVVNKVCKILNTKKVGHTGTLDPLATGVLVICVNKGTKLVEYLTDHDKDYIATVKLGILTDTLDITGNIIKKEKCKVDKNKLINTINSFNKTYMQEVPKYSAVKINGKKLYEYARSNEVINLPKREVTISNMEILEITDDSFTFKCTVSKGTYIRSLIKDICDEAGIIGVMSALNRTRVGKYAINEAIDIDDISSENIIPIIDVLDNILNIELNDELSHIVLNGQKYQFDSEYEYILFTKNGKAEALYKRSDNTYRMYRYFG